MKTASDFLKEHGLIEEINSKRIPIRQLNDYALVNCMNAFATYLSEKIHADWVDQYVNQNTNKDYEIEILRCQIVDRDMEIKELKEDIEELSNTLGLRNRSNTDLIIEPENTTTIFNEWKNCKE